MQYQLDHGSSANFLTAHALKHTSLIGLPAVVELNHRHRHRYFHNYLRLQYNYHSRGLSVRSKVTDPTAIIIRTKFVCFRYCHIREMKIILFPKTEAMFRDD